MRRFVVVALAACGGSPDPGPIEHDAPIIAALDPQVVAVGSPDLELVISGSNFTPDAVVLWDGDVRMPVASAETELRLAVTATDVFFPGAHEVYVINSGVGITRSNVARLDVVVPNRVPAIAALVPDRITVGAPDLPLEIQGSHFAIGAMVRWAGMDLAATRVDDEHVMVTVPAAQLATVGAYDVVVTNPAPGGGASPPRGFSVTDVAGPAGTLERVSVASDGGELPTGGQSEEVSSDGRYVAFATESDGVVPGDTNNRVDIYIRDTCRGAASCTPSTIPVSVKPDGSFQAAVNTGDMRATPDMRYVLIPGSNQLVPGLPNLALVVRDTCIGATACTPATTQASPAQVRSDVGFGISDDGRYVTFVTSVGYAAADTNGGLDVYVYDTCRGASACTPSSTLVSASTSGTGGNDASWYPSISANGRYVVFNSRAGDLVAGDTNGRADVFVRDTCIGATGCTPSTQRASVDATGTVTGALDMHMPSIDPTGRYVVFDTDRTLSASDTDVSADIYAYDSCAGASSCTPSVTLVTAPNFTGVFMYRANIVAANARYIAFLGFDQGYHAYVADTCLGAVACTPTTTLVSVPVGGGTADRSIDEIVLARGAGFAAFASSATNVVAGDTNGQRDVFLAATGF